MGEEGVAKFEPAVLEAAACWIARLHDPAVTAADIAAHRSWLAAHPSHTAAYDRMQDIWQRLEAARYHVGAYRATTFEVGDTPCQSASDLKSETDGTSNL